MLRNLVCAAAFLTVSFGIVLAEPVRGRITSIEGKKITVGGIGAKKGDKGETKTYELAGTVKVSKTAGKDKTEPVADGLGAAELKNIDAKKGVAAILEVNGNTVSEITIVAGKKKKE